MTLWYHEYRNELLIVTKVDVLTKDFKLGRIKGSTSWMVLTPYWTKIGSFS
jgi:hypothetical protein